MKRKKTPKVSVCVVTYNQEKYIRQCLQSIVDQEADFDFEVIVGEDCSTDETRAIVQEFVERYPKFVKAIFHNKNIGACANYISVHSAAMGEYIAHVDGDDLCCPTKLSIQVDYLNHNTDCIAVFHRMLICDKNHIRSNKLWPKISISEKHDINQVLLNLSDFVHSSMLYRSGALDDFMTLPLKEFIDYQVYIHLASKGNIACLERELGIYRYGIGESMGTKVFELMIQAVEYAYKLDAEKSVVDLVVAQKCLMISKRAFVNRDISLFRKLIRKSVFARIIGFEQLVLFLFSFAPGLLIILYFLKKSIQELYWKDIFSK